MLINLQETMSRSWTISIVFYRTKERIQWELQYRVSHCQPSYSRWCQVHWSKRMSMKVVCIRLNQMYNCHFSLPEFLVPISMTHFHLDAEYRVLATSVLCSERGLKNLEDINDCKKAAIALGIKDTPKESIEEGYPKGCYQHMEGSKHVFFNSHEKGSRHAHSAPICRNG